MISPGDALQAAAENALASTLHVRELAMASAAQPGDADLADLVVGGLGAGQHGDGRCPIIDVVQAGGGAVEPVDHGGGVATTRRRRVRRPHADSPRGDRGRLRIIPFDADDESAHLPDDATRAVVGEWGDLTAEEDLVAGFEPVDAEVGGIRILPRRRRLTDVELCAAAPEHPTRVAVRIDVDVDATELDVDRAVAVTGPEVHGDRVVAAGDAQPDQRDDRSGAAHHGTGVTGCSSSVPSASNAIMRACRPRSSTGV